MKPKPKPISTNLEASGGDRVAHQAMMARETTAAFSRLFEKLTWVTSLNAVERQRVLKAHTGIEPHALLLGQLVKDQPNLAPTGLDPEELVNAVDLATALTEFRTLLATQLQTIDDTYLVNRSRIYQDTLDIYAINKRNARRDPTLQQHMKQVEAFLSVGPRSKKSAKSPEPMPVTVSAPATPTVPEVDFVE